MTAYRQSTKETSSASGSRGLLRVIREDGETVHRIDPEDARSLARAEEVFDAMRAQGFLAYRVGMGGGRDALVRELDPDSGEIVLVPPMIGG